MKHFITFFLIMTVFLSLNSQVIVDRENIFTDSEEEQLIDKMLGVNEKTSVQLLVYTTPDMGGKDPGKFAMELYNQYGIGMQGINNGILLMVSLEERVFSVITGFGMEWILPDDTAAKIVDKAKLYFKEKNFYKGVNAALDIIHKKVTMVSWEVVSTSLEKISPKDQGKILEFRYTNKSGNRRHKYGLDTDPQFSDDFRILVSAGTVEYNLFYSKNMSEFVNDILNRKNVKIYARLADWNKRKLELLGVIRE